MEPAIASSQDKRILNSRKVIALIEVTLAVVVWGASFIATKVALRDVSPVTVVWLRFAMGVAILGVAVLARRQFAIPPTRELGYFALLGFLGITLHQWLQSTGLITAQATTSAWIVATIPVFTALLGWAVLKEKLGWIRVVGIALAAAGVLLVVTKGDLVSLTRGRVGTTGDFLVLLSAPNWAVFSVLSRRGLKEHPATFMLFYVMGVGWLLTSALFFTGPGFSELGRLTWQGWSGVLFLGVLCTGLAYIFYYDALKIIPASQVSAFIYIEPLVTAILAFPILREPLTAATMLGGGIILLGVWMVNRVQNPV